jgi:hypothetical protein
VTSYFFTRPLVALLARQRVFTKGRFLGVGGAVSRAETGLATGAVT